MAKAEIKLGWDKTNKRFQKAIKGHPRWHSSRGLKETDIAKALAEYLDHLKTLNQSEQDEINRQAALLPLSLMPDEIKERIGITKKQVATLHNAIDAYVAHKATKVSDGEVIRLRSHLSFFKSFLRSNLGTNGLTLEKWKEIWKEVSDRIEDDDKRPEGSKKWSDKYASSVLITIRNLYKWIFETHQINEIPRYINSSDYAVPVPSAQPDPFTAEEITKIMAAAEPEQKLHYLLMLNTGMTQIDLSGLKWEKPTRPEDWKTQSGFIDLKTGTLTRRRTKHRKQTSKNIPIVEYHLWPCVLALLPKKTAKGLIFTNERGKPLVQPRRNDCVGDRFATLRESLGIERTVKCFRKSGVSCLGTFVLKPWQDAYLANALSGTTEKAYDGTTELPVEVTEAIRVKFGL